LDWRASQNKTANTYVIEITLCAAVLPICGIDEMGVEKAIPRILAKQQAS